MEKLKWILIGKIVNTQGNKGEVRVFPHTDYPDRFSKMEQILLFPPGKNEPSINLKLENYRFHKEFVILKFNGIDNIDAAEKLINMEIKVDQKDVAPLPVDEHYVFQLIGLQIITTVGDLLGVITDVLQTSANDVYVVEPHSGLNRKQEILVPVVKQVVLDIDIGNQRVLIDLPDGLLD